jgi:RimJ/RimL family protein N-acetyltransferase
LAPPQEGLKLTGRRVLLRPMRTEDIARQHEFSQDVELFGLDCARPRVSPLEAAQALYDARFAIEADGAYIGYCGLSGLLHPYRSMELGMMIGDRADWGRGYGREVVALLLRYAFPYPGAWRLSSPHAPGTSRRFAVT